MLEAVGVIPVRYRSTRFPGKALAPISGKPMVQHVFERARAAHSLDRIIVATDDERIEQAVRGFGGEAMMTAPSHPTGTDRLAEVARKLEAPLYVNIQGDEPLVDPKDIDALVRSLQQDPEVEMATLKSPIMETEELENPSVVKVVTDSRGNALYFSRAAIPHGCPAASKVVFRHLGLYAFRRRLLLDFAAAPPGALERAEQLEQLRVLEMGRTIRVLLARGRSIGVDTPEDLDRVQTIIDRGP